MAGTTSSIPQHPQAAGAWLYVEGMRQSGSLWLPAVLGHRKPETENRVPHLLSNRHKGKQETRISSEPHPSPTQQ